MKALASVFKHTQVQMLLITIGLAIFLSATYSANLPLNFA